TGKPFAEVVLLHTLVYQVEQVFLIHRETGLLLQHVVAGSVKAMDADMVSGMLTAIQDFVQDSFGGDREDSLQTMQVGERTVWVEQGSQAVLAGVIQGSAPSRLRTVFEEAMESIHLEQREALQEFEGDASVFEPCRVHLEECLQSQFRAEEEPEKKSAWPVWLGLAVVGLGLGVWGYGEMRESRRWDAYLKRLDAEPGIVVTQAERRDGCFFVAGLRDPLAADPRAFLGAAELTPEQVAQSWEAYLSFRPEFALRRSQQLLAPPPGVKLEMVEGALHISGRAAHGWVTRVEALARAVPGVVDVELSGLEDVDQLRLDALEREVEGKVVYFGLGSARLEEESREDLAALAETIGQLEETGELLGKRVRLLLAGYADESGSEKANREISQKRADEVARLLIADGVLASNLQATGMGSLVSAGAGERFLDLAGERRVVFSVVLTGGED
ncbi:MAG: OmpA family protein, partial [Gemmatimonadetes bacterium]|nr:OmpA family protein [Gemmatimonadota bacterium]